MRRLAGFRLASLARKHMNRCTPHCWNRLSPRKPDQGFDSLLVEWQVVESTSSAPTDIRISIVQGFKEFSTFWHIQPPFFPGDIPPHKTTRLDHGDRGAQG